MPQLARAALRDRVLGGLLVAVGIGFFAFWELGDELGEGGLAPLDRTAGTLVRSHQTPTLYWLAVALSDLPTWPWVLLLATPVLVALMLRRQWQWLIWLLATPLATVVLVEILKAIFVRSRPLAAAIVAAGYSFPSGHAAGATALYGCLGYVAWRLWVRQPVARIVVAVVTATLAVSTGLARIYLGVHYPSDVLAGWSAGVCILAGAILVARRIARRAQR